MVRRRRHRGSGQGDASSGAGALAPGARGRCTRCFRARLELLGAVDSSDMAETLLQLADLHATSLGRTSDGLVYAERALAIVERLGDRRLTAEACYVIGNVRARGNDVAAGRTSLERALGLAQDLDEPALGAEICGYLANVYAWSGEFDRSREVFRPACGIGPAHAGPISAATRVRLACLQRHPARKVGRSGAALCRAASMSIALPAPNRGPISARTAACSVISRAVRGRRT